MACCLTDAVLPCLAAGTLAEGAFTEDLLPASGLVTSSDEYYPTVAINALMRLLRDPSLSSHHFQVLRSLFVIFRSLHLAAVPYLTKVINLLTNATRCCLMQTDTRSRELLCWADAQLWLPSLCCLQQPGPSVTHFGLPGLSFPSPYSPHQTG